MRKISKLESIIRSYIDDISSKTSILLEISPVVFQNQNQNFCENIHFEINDIIEELSSDTHLATNIGDSICGLLNILRQVSLNRSISEKFCKLSTKEISFCFSNYSCFYNAVINTKLSCEQCKIRLLKNMPLKLGLFDEMSKTVLEDTGEKSESKVLIADWDYIV